MATPLDVMSKQLDDSNRLMGMIAWYIHEQNKEARKTPGTTKLTTYNLLNPITPPTAMQIVPKNDKRASVAITNVGPADLLISEVWFDPTSILQHFSDPNFADAVLPGYNQAIDIGYLISGANVSLDGTTGIWAYSLGSAAESNQNAILSIADSIYVTSDAKPDSQVEAYHLSGLHPSEQPGGGAIN